MQCRYCFGEDETDTMVSACLCRGTSQYTHEACLQRYITYNPDRICRVCNARMEYVSPHERVLPCLFVPILAGFVMTSSAGFAAKMLLMIGLLGLSSLFAVYPVFTKGTAVASLLIGSLILCIHRDTQVTLVLLGILGIVALLRTLFHYVDAALLLLVAVCTFAISYTVFFAMAMSVHLDAIAHSILVIQLFLLWNSVLHLRPRLVHNRVHNE